MNPLKSYDTPIEVAKVLARHVPNSATSILEPSVGNGVLLAPLLHKPTKHLKRIVCIDVDKQALLEVERNLRPVFGSRLRVMCANFLKWSAYQSREEHQQTFDCVVMNPPFQARRSGWVKLGLLYNGLNGGGGDRRGPIEVAFVLRGVSLLRPGGTLLAILPASTVSSVSTHWLRQYLLKEGTIEYVHELPPFCFKRLGTRVYLFVYKKCVGQRNIILCNHDLAKPKRLYVRKENLLPDIRLDYHFHESLRCYRELRERTVHLGWTRVKDMVSVHRGSVKSPEGRKKAIHTTDYDQGFWFCDRKGLNKDFSAAGVKRGDLLVRRVSRKASLSIGVVIGHEGDACSDCVLIIRPNKKSVRVKLLFALRLFTAMGYGETLLERGTGATYLTEKDLLDLYVPMNLANRYSKAYGKYRRAITSGDRPTVKAIEDQMLRVLRRSVENRAGRDEGSSPLTAL